jgi:hypothetical protein
MSTTQDASLNSRATSYRWRIRDGRIGLPIGAKVTCAGSCASLLDRTRRRVTATRLATIGIFAFAAKKEAGEATVVITGADGSQISATTKNVVKAWEFVQAYNARYCA